MRPIVAAALAIGILLVVVGCGSRSERPTLTIGGGPNVSMLVIVAQKKGYFAEEGLTVDYRPLQTTKMAFDAVGARRIDVGVVTDAGMAILGYGGLGDVKVIGSIMTKTDDAIIARRASGIAAPADLRGKTIAYTPSSSGEVFLNFFLARHGLTAKDVTLTPMTAPAMLVAVDHGDVDAASVWQPFRYNIATGLGDRGVQFRNGDIYPARVLLIADATVVGGRDADLVKLFRALNKAAAYVRGNRDDAIALLSADVGIDPATLQAVWSEYRFEVGDTPDIGERLRLIAVAVTATQPDLAKRLLPDYAASVSLGAQFKAVKAR